MADASSCVDDEALFALARGELKGGELARAEAHLRDCADCRAVLAEASRALQPLTAQDPAARGGAANIARYQVVSLIGAGASGIVYRGFDPQLKRTVALKVLRPELHGAPLAQSERMLREAQAMARLSDPHVVAVYDVGLHQGTVYLVMEYIDGTTLSAWLKAEARSRSEISRVFEEAGRGLAAAHRKGLVHRDFKLENVLVARDGRAYVTDFGLARESANWLGDRVTDDQASTELYAPTRGLVGTPAYMAPELFEGGRATPASDQFAFCVALFVALFEQHPFKAGEGIALSELVTRVRGGTLQRPALGTPSDERLFAVLRRGLAPEPATRFADLPALLSALTGAARGSGKARLALGLALLVGVLVVVASQWAREVPPQHAAPPPVERASAEALAVALPAGNSSAPVATASALPGRSQALRSRRISSSTPPPENGKHPPAPKAGDVRYKDWLKEPF